MFRSRPIPRCFWTRCGEEGGRIIRMRPPAFNGQWLGVWAEMHHFAIARHDKGVNVLFFDGSVRYSPAKKLWNYYWHNHYDTTYAADHIRFPARMN